MGPCEPLPGKFLGMVGQDPSDSKSSRLDIDIFRFCFHSFEVYSIESSKLMGNFFEALNSNWFFLNSIGSSVTNCRFFPSSVVNTIAQASDIWVPVVTSSCIVYPFRESRGVRLCGGITILPIFYA